MKAKICRRRHKHRKGVSMKKKLVLSAMLVCLLALGLALIGCDNGSTSGDIVPIELQGTWVNPSVGTGTLYGSLLTTTGTDGITITENVTSVQKGSIAYVNGTAYTRYTVRTSQGSVLELGLTQDGQTLMRGDGYIFTKV
jgi:uncharacterized lipoprotein NlpE involved in copper resistance